MKKFLALCAAAVLLAAAAPAEAATGRIKLMNDDYIVVQMDPPSYNRYTGAHMYSALPYNVRNGDRVEGVEEAMKRQVWIIDGREVRVGVEDYAMTADQAMEYFSKHSR